MPYGTMAAVESTSVISILLHDCCGSFELFGGLWEKLTTWLESDPMRRFGPSPASIIFLEKSVRSIGHAKLNRPME